MIIILPKKIPKKYENSAHFSILSATFFDSRRIVTMKQQELLKKNNFFKLMGIIKKEAHNYCHF